MVDTLSGGRVEIGVGSGSGPEEYAVGAVTRATTSAGAPEPLCHTAATPGPATSRNLLPSRPAGGGGSVSPAAAAACAARSAEKVNSATA